MTRLLASSIASLCLLACASAVSAEPVAYDFRVKRRVRIIDFPSCTALHSLRVFVPFLGTDCIGSDGTGSAEPVIHIDTVNATGRFLINEFLRQDPRYTAIIDGDFVVIMSSRAAADPDYLLNLVVDRFVVKDTRLSEVARLLARELEKKTGRRIGYLPATDGYISATLDLSSRTARNIMLEAAAENNYDSVQFEVIEDDTFRYYESGTAWDPIWETYSPEVEAVLKRRGVRKGPWH